MKKILLLIFGLSINLGFSQTKQQLINSIVKVNSLQSNCIGIGCSESKQFKNFQLLKNMLSDEELFALSKHKEPVIRAYVAIEMIESQKGSVVDLLSTELTKGEDVETFRGCIISQLPLSFIIYNHYLNKIRIEAMQKNGGNNYEQDIAYKKAVATDIAMQQLDSLVLFSKQQEASLLYHYVFENRKYKENYLTRIEELAFQENEMSAFRYIKEYHIATHSTQIENYFKHNFLKADFSAGEKVFDLFWFIETLLKSNNEDHRQLAIQKLATDAVWKKRSWKFQELLKKYGIELKENHK